MEADVGSELCHGSARDVCPGWVPGDRGKPWCWWHAQRQGRATEPWGWREPFEGTRSCGTAGDVATLEGGPCVASPSPRWERGARRGLPGATR